MGEALHRLYRGAEADRAFVKARELGWKLEDNYIMKNI
jgi:hypothetical protein